MQKTRYRIAGRFVSKAAYARAYRAGKPRLQSESYSTKTHRVIKKSIARPEPKKRFVPKPPPRRPAPPPPRKPPITKKPPIKKPAPPAPPKPPAPSKRKIGDYAPEPHERRRIDALQWTTADWRKRKYKPRTARPRKSAKQRKYTVVDMVIVSLECLVPGLYPKDIRVKGEPLVYDEHGHKLVQIFNEVFAIIEHQAACYIPVDEAGNYLADLEALTFRVLATEPLTEGGHAEAEMYYSTAHYTESDGSDYFRTFISRRQIAEIRYIRH